MVFYLPSDNVTVSNKSPNAFPTLISNSKKLQAVSKIITRNSKDKLYNDIIDLFIKQGVLFTSNNVQTIGVSLTKNLCNLLWHIISHHKYFVERGKPVPKVFQSFGNLNDYVSKKIAKPRLSAKELNQYIESLSSNLTHPWLCRADISSFHSHLVELLDASKSIVSHMNRNLHASTSKHMLIEPRY